MRLDQFLKVSRIIKRRTVAKEFCDKELVFVNGRPAKSAKEVHEGDIVRVNFSSKTLTFQILSIPRGNVSISEASTLYKTISEEQNN